MKISYKKLSYIKFFLLKNKENFFLRIGTSIELYQINNELLAPKYVKLISNIPVFLTSSVGKTTEMKTLSILNDFSLNYFIKRNFYIDSLLNVGSDLIRFFFINKKKLDILGKDSFYLFVGTEIRCEEPLLNLILRKNFIEKGGNFFSIGSRLSANFYIRNIGLSSKKLANFIFGNHWAVNLYYKSLSSFFIFGKTFFGSKSNLDLFYKFARLGIGNRKNDIVFFSGFVSSYLSSLLLGLSNFSFEINKMKYSPILLSFYYNSTFVYPTNKNEFFNFCFDHNFTSLTRKFGDVIIPQHNFVEKKTSLFLNCFNEIKIVSGCLIKDVESLFEMSYKKSFDSFVYDYRIFNFSKLRSSIISHIMNSKKNALLKIAQFNPILFFSYEHLYNVSDATLLNKVMFESQIFQRQYIGDFYNNFNNKFNLNNNLLTASSFINLNEINFYRSGNNIINLSNSVLINNKIYFDPENDTLSNSSVLLLKTYKRVVLQTTNFI